MEYAALIRPVIDRVYVGLRRASGPRVRELYEAAGLRPGFEISFYFGLLARPISAAGFVAATTYSGSDMTDELEQGTAVVDADGGWRLTESGRELALAVQRAIAEGAEEFWSDRLGDLPRLVELVGRLLDAGLATGGPAYLAMVPAYEPEPASPALRLTTRLGALRHHRADAHRAAWAAAGVGLDELRAMSDEDPVRRAIEVQTNQLDSPIYAALSDTERLELLAGLGALPG